MNPDSSKKPPSSESSASLLRRYLSNLSADGLARVYCLMESVAIGMVQNKICTREVANQFVLTSLQVAEESYPHLEFPLKLLLQQLDSPSQLLLQGLDTKASH